jgi:hypothetical protein
MAVVRDRREAKATPKAAPRPLGVRARRAGTSAKKPLRRLYKWLRFSGRGRKGVERAPRWPQPRMLIVIGKWLAYGGAAVLVLLIVRALVTVIGFRHPINFPWAINPDNSCSNTGYSCGVVNSIVMTVLSLAFVAAIFFFYRLGHLRRPYVRRARNDTVEVVQTAGTIIGDVVGRDELCHVIMDDLRDRKSRRPHVLVGGVGTGKTAVLFQLTKVLAENGAVPVPVRLRDARTDLDFEALARERFINEVAIGSFSSAEGDKVWRELRKDDQLVVLADGLEEALSGPDASGNGDSSESQGERDNRIRLAIRAAHRNRLPLVVASRPHDALVGVDAAVIELEPLGEEAALEYIEQGASKREERRIDWVIETAEITETPLYLQIARELHERNLLHWASPRGREDRLDMRGYDRAALRASLLRTWTTALTKGHFKAEVPYGAKLREATVAELAALACVGLKKDNLEVRFADLLGSKPAVDTPTADPSTPYPLLIETLKERVREARKDDDQRAETEGARVSIKREIRLAATRGAQLRLVEPRAEGVRFPHSIMQAYLASRVIADVMEEDLSFLNEALKEPGRELLLALVMHSRSPADSEDRREEWHEQVHTALLKAGRHGELGVAKSIDILAAAMEVDSARKQPRHETIARALHINWPKPSEDRTVEDAKLKAIDRFGETALSIGQRMRERDALPDLRPAYAELYAIGHEDLSYPVRVAAAQELGAGGDAVLELVENDPFPAGAEWKDDDAHRRFVLNAWLTPLLVGSVSDTGPTPTPATRANDLLERWLERVEGEQSDQRLPLSLEVALAQGFKYAANRRPQHPHARDEARLQLAEQAARMLYEARFWFSRLTLVHALCLWSLPGIEGNRDRRKSGRGLNGARRNHGSEEERHRGIDPEALVRHWLSSEIEGTEHPFVAEAHQLAVLALEKRQPERFIWIDESGVVTKIGARPPSSDVIRKHNLWIPPGTGWSALHPRAQKLVADVLLMLNLTERKGIPAERERRLKRAMRNDLPPCLTGEREYLEPNRTVGTVEMPPPGARCKDGCSFDLCPYPPKGGQPYRVELSEAFCRRQRVLLGKWPTPFPRRTARWQGALPGDLARFWTSMEKRARL